MPLESRAAPHLLLGILTVLAIGAIVLSLDTAPPNAQLQLQQAAKNTVGADSFVLQDTITIVPSTGATASQARTETADVVYHAPDQVQETVRFNGRMLTVLAIGSTRYERSGTGKWLSLGTQPGTVPAGRQAAAGVLGPLEVVTTATNVVRHGDAFVFEPATGQLAAILSELLGSQGAQLPAGSATFAAAMAGEYLSRLDVDASVPGGRVLVHLSFGSYGEAPALAPPPPSQRSGGARVSG